MTTSVRQWKDWAAVSAMCGNRCHFDCEEPGFKPDALLRPIKIQTIMDAVSTTFPIPYEKGSVIVQVRVKFQGGAANDGVKLRILKRDESSNATAWTIVGEEKTYLSSAVTVSTYNGPDTAILENYSYIIEITSVIGTTAVALFSIGIETKKRML